MEGVFQDFRHSARALRRNPGFTAVAVLALTLGIGTNTAVFTVVNSVLLRALPYPEPDRLLLLSNGPGNGGPAMRLSDRDYLEFRRHDRLLAGLATFESRGFDVTGIGEPAYLPGACITADFLRMLDIQPSLGRAFRTSDERAKDGPVVVVGYLLWRDRFGADPNVLGRKLKVDGVDHTVVGVMPPGFDYPDQAALWTPLEIRGDSPVIFLRPAVGRMKPGVSRQQVQAELEAMRPSGGIEVQSFQNLMVRGIREPLLIFAGAVGFVLLIACANVANLLIIRIASREQEIGIRAALGASAGRLVRQVLSESTLISLIAGAAGLLAAMWGVPLLLALAPQGLIPRTGEIHIDGWVLAFTFSASVLTGLLVGLAPAFRITRRPLRGATRFLGRTQADLRNFLTVTELALVVVLLTGAGLMVKSFLRMRAVDPGFHPENVLTMAVALPNSIYPTFVAKLGFQTRLLVKLSFLYSRSHRRGSCGHPPPRRVRAQRKAARCRPETPFRLPGGQTLR
jgi:predicted permease